MAKVSLTTEPEGGSRSLKDTAVASRRGPSRSRGLRCFYFPASFATIGAIASMPRPCVVMYEIPYRSRFARAFDHFIDATEEHERAGSLASGRKSELPPQSRPSLAVSPSLHPDEDVQFERFEA